MHRAGSPRAVAFSEDGLTAFAIGRGGVVKLEALSFSRRVLVRRAGPGRTAIAVDVAGTVWTARGRDLVAHLPRTLRPTTTVHLRARVLKIVPAGGFLLAVTRQGLTVVDVARRQAVRTIPVAGATAVAYAVL